MYSIILISFHLVILWRYSITTKIICIICFSVFIHCLFIHSRCPATSLKKWHLLTIIFYSLPLSFLEITSLQKPWQNKWRFITDSWTILSWWCFTEITMIIQWFFFISNYIDKNNTNRFIHLSKQLETFGMLLIFSLHFIEVIETLWSIYQSIFIKAITIFYV